MTSSSMTTLRGISLIVLLTVPGCANKARTGAAGGAGVGSLVGQVAGRSGKATLIGAGVGAGIGYVVGNEVDKKEAERYRDADEQGPYNYETLAPLAGTRWAIASLQPKDTVPEYASKLVEFRPNSRVITTTTNPDGTIIVADEHYRVVGKTLIINKPDYLINAVFSIEGEQLIISSDDFRAVLNRVK